MDVLDNPCTGANAKMLQFWPCSNGSGGDCSGSRSKVSFKMPSAAVAAADGIAGQLTVGMSLANTITTTITRMHLLERAVM